MKTIHLTYIVLLTAAVLAWNGCAKRIASRPGGVTILVLDGATWDVIDHMIDKGELPGFKLLKEQGSWGYLATHVPTDSVSIWTTIATGVSPVRHGIQTFTRRIPGTDRYVPTPGTDRLVPALWNMVSDQGKRVVSVKWFASWPAEAVNGAMLSPRLETEDSEPRTYPRELFYEIDTFRYESTMDDLPQPPRPDRNRGTIGQPAIIRSDSLSRSPPMLIGQRHVPSKMFDDTSVWLAARYVYEKFRPDLFMVYMKSTDRVQHFLWGSHEHEDADPVRKAEAEAIYGWYRFYDDIILELLEDETRILMVVSDHGFQALDSVSEHYFVWDIDFDRILEHGGFLRRKGPTTVWPETQVYTYRLLPFNREVVFTGNLMDREPEGTVLREDISDTLNRLVFFLENLRNQDRHGLFSDIRISDDNHRVFCRISDAITLQDTVFCGDHPVRLKDIVIQKGFPRGVHIDGPPGIIAVHGPGIQKNRTLSNATIFDVTPTALHVLGLPVAADFDGSVLTPIFDAFRTPVQIIPTYGTRSVPGELTTTGGDARMLDELRALGYIQ